MSLRAIEPTSATRVRRLLWNHPEWWVSLSSVVAWVLILFVEPRLDPSGQLDPPGSVLRHLALEVVLCLGMTAAMMFPLIVPTARHVGLSSYWPRRYRATMAFVGGYLAVWMPASLTILAVLHLLYPFLGKSGTIAASFGAAAFWQVTPWKRRALSRCHRLVSLASDGWRADADCVMFGAIIGRSCMTACWGLMAAAMSTHALVAMAVLLPVQVWERSRRRPRMEASAMFMVGLGGVVLLWHAGWPSVDS